MKFEKMTRNELRDLLSENVLRVTFDKKNGEKRVMTCTLKKDYLPEAKGSSNYKEAMTSLSVWDTNANGWRAFCLDKIRDIEKV
jgi:hypothetical protein|tara:strand:- start:1510 stop:1761 length:252 start_codon:yes stop_codon:yes gene_type:complete